MLTFARILRVLFGVLVVLAFLCAARGVWVAIADYQMETREHWQYRCDYVQFAGGYRLCGKFFRVSEDDRMDAQIEWIIKRLTNR